MLLHLKRTVNMKTNLQIGKPYNIIFSNKHLSSQYVQETRKEEKTSGRNVKNSNNKLPFSKTTLKRLKTILICTGSCIALISYISLMILGGFVCILIL